MSRFPTSEHQTQALAAWLAKERITAPMQPLRLAVSGEADDVTADDLRAMLLQLVAIQESRYQAEDEVESGFLANELQSTAEDLAAMLQRAVMC